MVLSRHCLRIIWQNYPGLEQSCHYEIVLHTLFGQVVCTHTMSCKAAYNSKFCGGGDIGGDRELLAEGQKRLRQYYLTG